VAEPPRDRHGLITPHDDATISNDDRVIRYIHPVHGVILDANLGRQRLSSGAFSASSVPHYGMSVDVERWMHEAGLSSLGRLPTPSYGAVVLQAGAMRGLGLMVGGSPIADNPFHAEIWRVKGKIRARIRDLAQWLKQPEGYDGE